MRGPEVKLITGVLYPDEDRFEWVRAELEKRWGIVDIISRPVPFDLTDYYRNISPVLYRRFLCFKGTADAGRLADWKHEACKVEAVSRSPRAVNIDPGYVDGARLVLASTKDHAHRIYVRDGIFAEVTLRYRFGKWTPFDYTFPDFARGLYDDFMTMARSAWLSEVERKGHNPRKVNSI